MQVVFLSNIFEVTCMEACLTSLNVCVARP